MTRFPQIPNVFSNIFREARQQEHLRQQHRKHHHHHHRGSSSSGGCSTCGAPGCPASSGKDSSSGGGGGGSRRASMIRSRSGGEVSCSDSLSTQVSHQRNPFLSILRAFSKNEKICSTHLPFRVRAIPWEKRVLAEVRCVSACGDLPYLLCVYKD